MLHAILEATFQEIGWRGMEKSMNSLYLQTHGNVPGLWQHIYIRGSDLSLSGFVFLFSINFELNCINKYVCQKKIWLCKYTSKCHISRPFEWRLIFQREVGYSEDYVLGLTW